MNREQTYRLLQYYSSYFLERETSKKIRVFFAVGTLGYLFPYSRPFFIQITGITLLLTCFFLGYFHENRRSGSTRLFFCLGSIAVCGFIAEIVGVNSQLLFGEYRYGRALGVQLWNTPLLIGINWAMLSYLFAEFSSRIAHRKIYRIALGTLGMLTYDFVLEQVAPLLQYWQWNDGVIPPKNYIDWTIFAFCFQCIMVFFLPVYRNKVVGHIVMCHLIMFLIIWGVNFISQF